MDKFVKLTDVCDFQGGSQPPKKLWIKEHKEGYIRMLQIRDFTQTGIVLEYVPYSNNLKQCSSDDVLIARYGASIGKIVTGLEGAYNVALMKVTPDLNILSKRYLFYYLNSSLFQNLLGNIGSRSAQAGFNKNDLNRSNIFLPNKKRQYEIVSILDNCQSLIRKRQQQIEALLALKQSVFLNMFGDPIKNDKKWQTNKIKEFSDSIVPGRNKPKSFTGHIPWITTEDLIDKGITYKSKSEIGLTEAEIKKVNARVIPRESVLMTCVGDLGRVSIAGKDCVVNQQLHTYQPTEYLNNIFLMYFLSYQKPYMYKYATTTTVPYMNKTTCNNMIVYLPPIELQESFAQKVIQIDQRLNLIFNSLEELKLLYDLLLHKAFNGKLFKEEIKA